jgi:hypothetical protein
MTEDFGIGGTTTADFRLALMAQLTVLSEGQKSIHDGMGQICKKLDQANGNIDDLFDRAAAGVIALKDHIIQCPQSTKIETLRLRLEILDKELALGDHPGSRKINERVQTLEQNMVADQAKVKLSRWLVNLLWPALSAGGGALIMYVIETAHHAAK